MVSESTILSILLQQLTETDSPWLTADELWAILSAQGKQIPKDELAKEVAGLRDEGFLELVSVSKDSLDRGYITRMTVPGRNKWVHGHSLTGS